MSSDNPSAGGSEDESLSSCVRQAFESEPSFEEPTSSAYLSSEDSLSAFSLKDFTKDDPVAYEDYGKKSVIEDAVKTETPTELVSSGQKSPLFRHREGREASPFKEALKGFVLSKLTKKPGTLESTSSIESGDKRTLFSGIKEKIVKKLEDSSSKEIVSTKDISLNVANLNSSPINANVIRKSECELKSVVANDHSDSIIVEKAEECFEEIKITLTSSSNIICDNVPVMEPNPLPCGTPRSKTMSNIAATAHQMLRPKMISDKNLSISFSDLQKANELDVDADILEQKSEPQFSRSAENPGLSAIPNSLRDEEANNSNAEELPCPTTGSVCSTKKLKQFPDFLQRHLKSSIWADIFIVLIAIFTYYFFYNRPFFAGLLCGVLLVIFLWLLYTEFTKGLMQSDYISTPTYKTLPPLHGIPVEEKSCFHEGWMNQLIGEYNPDTYKMTDTISVYVHIQDTKMHLSYPKKNIPRRAMWNEKKINNNPICREESYSLKGAKITLMPESLRHSRIWNKRYPLCILLVKEDRKTMFSSDLHPRQDEKDSELCTKPPSSSSSQSGSLSSTPVHVASNHNAIYLFSRTDREKEEWYLKFCTAAKTDEGIQAVDKIEIDDVPTQSASENDVKSGSTVVQKSSKTSTFSAKEDEMPKSSPFHKPTLDFHHYMKLLIDQELIDTKQKELYSEPHTQWLNVFFGRLFFDFLVQKKWADRVMEKIQYKLDRIKMPQYMQKLVVTDVYLGTCLPQIQKMSEIVADERGLWLDLDIHYQGYFQMTLETKLKSYTRPVSERHPGEETDSVPELSSDAISEEIPEYWDEEEELPDSETSKEESPLHQPSVSTGAKLLHSVERWVTSSNIAENSFVKRYVGQLMQARLLLTVEINSLHGTLSINLPPQPTDRLWYGFKTNPELSLNVFPKVGERHISLLPVVQLIKRKLLQEFQKAVVMPNMDDLVVPIMQSSVCDE